MLEKYLEKNCCRKVKDVGGIPIKLSPVGYGGIPDRMMLLPGGKIMFVEFKQIGKKPTALQAAWLNRLRKLGFEARWCDNSVMFEKWLAEVRQPIG